MVIPRNFEFDVFVSGVLLIFKEKSAHISESVKIINWLLEALRESLFVISHVFKFSSS